MWIKLIVVAKNVGGCMEREFTCKKLEVTYGEEKMFLSGPHCAEILLICPK